MDDLESRLLERVIAAITRYNMIPRGSRLGVAVSGGADSVCLLHLLSELATGWNLHLTVLHLNHKLRPESDADEAFVRELAARFSLPFESAAADVGGVAASAGSNLEETARRLRREFFAQFLREGRLDRIALGHTRSDQAETVLFRLLRGTGLSGLAGILPVTVEGLVRPLIEIERVDVEQWLRERTIAWREDSTNQDCTFARNRIRHRLIPALRADWNPEVTAALAGLAALAFDEERFWEAYVEEIAVRIVEVKGEALLVCARQILELPRAVARRLIRHVIFRTKGDLRQVESAHVERILELTGQPEGHGRLQIPGVDVFRSFDWLRFAKIRPGMFAGQDYEFQIEVPGSVALPGSGSRVCVEVIERQQGENLSVTCARVGEVDWRRVPGPLCLRNWRPGDQYQPVGHSQEQKVKLLFQHARIPLWERRGWPIISSGDKIIWARQFGPAAEYVADSQTCHVLRIWEESGAGAESGIGVSTSLY